MAPTEIPFTDEMRAAARTVLERGWYPHPSAGRTPLHPSTKRKLQAVVSGEVASLTEAAYSTAHPALGHDGGLQGAPQSASRATLAGATG
jgi:hypothetical protein